MTNRAGRRRRHERHKWKRRVMRYYTDLWQRFREQVFTGLAVRYEHRNYPWQQRTP